MYSEKLKIDICQLIKSKYSEIIFVYIFGSFVTNKINSSSDFDIAFYINNNKIKAFKNRKIELVNDINLIVSREVDAIILNESPPVLTQQILTKGILILDNNHNKHTEFKVYSMFKYFTYKNVMDKMFEIRKNRIKEKSQNG